MYGSELKWACCDCSPLDSAPTQGKKQGADADRQREREKYNTFASEEQNDVIVHTPACGGVQLHQEPAKKGINNAPRCLK